MSRGRDKPSKTASERPGAGGSDLPRWLLPLIVAVALALAGWALNKAPNLYPPTTVPLLPADPQPAIQAARESANAAREAGRLAAIAATRASVLAALAGAGALLTIWINYRNSRTQAETFRVAERGHLTDRYAKAIELLGDAEHLPIRLGGIYALQQLALDTTVAGDRNTVREVLAAFVRTNATEHPTTRSLGPVGAPAPSTATSGPKPLPVDVRAAIDVLGRIRRDGDPPADLRRVHLANADLAGADLAGANLARAELYGANLTSANLIGANLIGAALIGANLRGAALCRTTLTDAYLADARLNGADLTGADLGRATLQRATLSFATLSEVDLCDAKLTGANLTGAHLTAASLFGADLTGADLTVARLTGAYLSGADLTGVNLTATTLEDADLYDVRGFEFSEEQLRAVARRPDGTAGQPASPADPDEQT